MLRVPELQSNVAGNAEQGLQANTQPKDNGEWWYNIRCVNVLCVALWDMM